MILYVTITNGYIIRPSITYQSYNTIKDSRKFWKEWYYITYIIYIDIRSHLE